MSLNIYPQATSEGHPEFNEHLMLKTMTTSELDVGMYVILPSSHNMHELGEGFSLHDLGKVQVDPTIIN